MKSFLLLSLASLVPTCATFADQVLHFPENDPVVAFAAPDDWKPKVKNGSLFVLPPDGDDVIVELFTMEAGIDDTKAAVAEAKETINEFKNLKYDEIQQTKSNTLDVTILHALGEDTHGEAKLDLMILGAPGATHPVLVSVIASKDGLRKHTDGMNLILKSLQPSPKRKAKAATDAPAKVAAVKKFSYPAKGAPTYSLDFPASWQMDATDEGAHVVSADKGIGMNLLMIDMADVDVAMEGLKKKVGADYKSIKWNEGSTQNDATKGVTVKSLDGDAMDGDVKYKVTFAQFAKKGSDKFLLILTQAPEKAMDANGEAMMKVLMSIKVN